MAKVKQPLLSFDARRSLGDDIVFKRQGRTTIVETRPLPADVRSVGQLSWRHMFQKVVALWHALSANEKEAWESLGRARHMTGYSWFVSQALRPNPGIYLPLQGGIMSGDIDMDGNRIEDLPDPVMAQDPVTRQYFEDNLPVGGYTKGARVYHNANQAIPHITWTFLAFNSERYDTDTIHDTVTNNPRLTCKTAGKYVIVFDGQIDTIVNGSVFAARFILGAVTEIAFVSESVGANIGAFANLVTIYDLAVNQFVRVEVYQDSGIARNLISSPNRSPEFMMQRIG